MSKIYGRPIATPLNPEKLGKDSVKTVNGIAPDENGNVVVQGGNGSGGNADLTGYATEQWVKGYAQPVGDYLTEDDLNGYAQTSDIPTKPEDIGAQPSGNYALKTEIPNVPVQSVNGKTGAVSLSASDVGARPSTWMPTHSDVGADKSGTASSAVSTHNTNTAAHNDIRLLITALATRLDALANSDDTTLDQMAEVVAYIKANRDLIDQITTGKVSVSDIVNNLTTNVSNKPLSAAQGVALKALIDAITVPTKLSQLSNDKGYITGYTETDPTVPSWAKASSKPSYSKSEVGLGNVDNVKQYSASNPPPYPVTSVNGKTGAVTIDGAQDKIEILLPSEIVAVVGVEFNMYYKSFIRANRTLDNYEIKCALSDTSVGYKLYKECFRLTAVDANVGSHTLTVQVKDAISGSVKAEKAVTFHIIKNRSLNNKNVLYLGDSLTFSRGGLYPAEIQYNLSGGKLVSIGSQIGSTESNGIGQVRHEGYNGATVGGFLSANVTSGNVNKFYNPSTGQFDLAYFMTNQGYTQIDAVCLNLGHNNLGNHVNAVSGLQTIISKIHEYNADIPVIISLIEPLAGQDGWTAKTKSTAIEMNRHWKNLISAYITAFDNGKISNVYLSAPYLNIDADNDFPTETVARSARDTTQIDRQNDAMHPGKTGTLKMADVYFANLMYRIPEDNAIYYTVTNNLTNVTTTNNVGSIKEGSAYTATLTPVDGYVLDSVTVTMGGNPVAVTNGVINISGVTGDIVITATAKVYVPAYANLAKPSTANDASPNTALTADEWLNGYYISSKKVSAKADLIVTNKIPLTFNDTIRIKGFATTGTIGGNSCASRFRVLPCDANGNALLTEIQPAIANSSAGAGRLEYMDATELEKGIYCFSPKTDYAPSYWNGVAFVRICGYPIDGNNANVIVTVNEEITD